MFVCIYILYIIFSILFTFHIHIPIYQFSYILGIFNRFAAFCYTYTLLTSLVQAKVNIALQLETKNRSVLSQAKRNLTQWFWVHSTFLIII